MVTFVLFLSVVFEFSSILVSSRSYATCKCGGGCGAFQCDPATFRGCDCVDCLCRYSPGGEAVNAKGPFQTQG